MRCPGSSLEQWAVKLPMGNTVDAPKVCVKFSFLFTQNYFQDKGSKPFKILHVTDLHYEPLYTEGKSLKCKTPMCCQPDQTDEDKGEKCQTWSNYVKSDTPLKTVEAVFKRAQKEVSSDSVCL